MLTLYVYVNIDPHDISSLVIDSLIKRETKEKDIAIAPITFTFAKDWWLLAFSVSFGRLFLAAARGY